MSYNDDIIQEGPLSFKVILLGDSSKTISKLGVGKTCFIRQFIDNEFLLKSKPTCSVDFVTKIY
jgi:GTPase SAR1 family protein